MKVGDIIKSYDFHFNTNSYVVGVVTKVDDCCVEFDTIKMVWQNEILNPSEYDPKMRAPKQGMLMADEKFERIFVIA